MYMHCKFCSKELKGLGMYLLILGQNSITICDDCAAIHRSQGTTLTGL